MKVSEHPYKCTYSSCCFYKSESDRPSLRRIIAEGSRIDKLYLGKFIPLREQNLLRKLATTRAVYYHLRNGELENELTFSKKQSEENIQNSSKGNTSTDSTSVILGLISLKTKDENLQTHTADECACYSCNSSILAHEAGTKYVCDNGDKKVYKVTKPRKKSDCVCPSVKPIRSEPMSKCTLTSNIDRKVKAKSFISQCKNLCQSHLKQGVEYTCSTMAEGTLPCVGAKDVAKPLIGMDTVSSFGDKICPNKNNELGKTASCVTEDNCTIKRTLRRRFCALKLNNTFTKPRFIETTSKELPDGGCDFPRCPYKKPKNNIFLTLKPTGVSHKCSSKKLPDAGCDFPNCPYKNSKLTPSVASKHTHISHKTDQKKQTNEGCDFPKCPYKKSKTFSILMPKLTHIWHKCASKEISKEGCDSPKCPYKKATRNSPLSSNQEGCDSPKCPYKKATRNSPLSTNLSKMLYQNASKKQPDVTCASPKCPNKKQKRNLLIPKPVHASQSESVSKIIPEVTCDSPKCPSKTVKQTPPQLPKPIHTPPKIASKDLPNGGCEFPNCPYKKPELSPPLSPNLIHKPCKIASKELADGGCDFPKCPYKKSKENSPLMPKLIHTSPEIIPNGLPDRGCDFPKCPNKKLKRTPPFFLKSVHTPPEFASKELYDGGCDFPKCSAKKLKPIPPRSPKTTHTTPKRGSKELTNEGCNFPKCPYKKTKQTPALLPKPNHTLASKKLPDGGCDFPKCPYKNEKKIPSLICKPARPKAKDTKSIHSFGKRLNKLSNCKSITSEKFISKNQPNVRRTTKLIRPVEYEFLETPHESKWLLYPGIKYINTIERQNYSDLPLSTNEKKYICPNYCRHDAGENIAIPITGNVKPIMSQNILNNNKKCISEGGKSSVGNKDRKLFATTINRCFSKIIKCGKLKNKEILTPESLTLRSSFCTVACNTESKHIESKSNYSDSIELSRPYKRKRSETFNIFDIPVQSVSTMPCNPNINSITETGIYHINRRRTRRGKCRNQNNPKSKRNAVPFQESSSSYSRPCHDLKNSSLFCFDGTMTDRSLVKSPSKTSIPQYEWRPINLKKNKSRTNVTHKARKSRSGKELKESACTLSFTRNFSRPQQLYTINTAETFKIIKPCNFFHPSLCLRQFQSKEDLILFEQVSSHSKFSSTNIFPKLHAQSEENLQVKSTCLLESQLTDNTSSMSQFSDHCSLIVNMARSEQCISKARLIKCFEHLSGSSDFLHSKAQRKSTPSFHLDQICVMNVGVADTRMKHYDDCDPFVCLTKICEKRKRVRGKNKKQKQCTTYNFSTSPAIQIKEKCIQHHDYQLEMSSQTSTCQRPKYKKKRPEPVQCKEKNIQVNRQRKDPCKTVATINISTESCKSFLKRPKCQEKGRPCPLRHISSDTGNQRKKRKEKVTTMDKPKKECKPTEVTRIRTRRKASKGTVTEFKKRDAQTAARYENTSVHPKTKRKRENPQPNPNLAPCGRQRKPHTSKCSLRCPSRRSDKNLLKPQGSNPKYSGKIINSQKSSKSSGNVTFTGKVTVCKARQGIIIRHNSTCYIQTPEKQISKQKSVGPKIRKKTQKGTSSTTDTPFGLLICNEKPVNPKMKTIPILCKNGSMSGKLKSGDCMRIVVPGCPRKRRAKLQSSSSDVCRTNITFQTKGKQSKQFKIQKAPKTASKSSSVKSGDCNTSSQSLHKFKHVKTSSIDSAAKAKYNRKRMQKLNERCFCTAKLNNYQKVYYMPVVQTSHFSDYQTEFSDSSCFDNQFSPKNINHAYKSFAPYEFVPNECEPSEYIKRVIRKKNIKKIKLPYKSSEDKMSRHQAKKCRHCARLNRSKANIPSDDLIKYYNKNIISFENLYTYQNKECYPDNSIPQNNISRMSIFSSSYINSTISEGCTSDSMKLSSRTDNLNLTGMSPHLKKNLYALRLETYTKPGTTCVGVGSRKAELKFTKTPKKQRNKEMELEPFECNPADCKSGNYNPKKCNKIMKARMDLRKRNLSPGECDPWDCAAGKFNPQYCVKKIKMRDNKQNTKIETLNPKLKQNTNNDQQNHDNSNNTNNNQIISNKQQKNYTPSTDSKPNEPKSKRTPYIVEEKRFKGLKNRLDSGINITSSISIDIQFYRQEKFPRPTREKSPVPESSPKTTQPPPPPTHKSSAETSTDQKTVSTNVQKQLPPKKPTDVSRTVQYPEKKNAIQKCFCALKQMVGINGQNVGTKQIAGRVADVGVATKSKYLEPVVCVPAEYYPYKPVKTPEKKTRTLSTGTDVPKRSLYTSTKKTAYKNKQVDVPKIPVQSGVQTHSSTTMTKKLKPAIEPTKITTLKTPKRPRHRFSDFSFTSRLSFDIELSRFENAPSNPKGKAPARKAATTKLPYKASSETVLDTGNYNVNTNSKNVHPSLKHCICNMRLQKCPYSQKATVNYVSTTVTPSFNLKHTFSGQQTTVNHRKYSKPKVINEFCKNFTANFFFIKPLFKSPEVIKHSLLKYQLNEATGPCQGKHRSSFYKQNAITSEMKIIYPYNSNKFNNNISHTIISNNRYNKLKSYRHSRNHYLQYESNTNKQRFKRRSNTKKHTGNDKQPNKDKFLNKLRKVLQSALKIFHRRHKDTRNRSESFTHIETMKRKKEKSGIHKIDVLKTSKSDRHKCYVAKTYDPLKTSKSERTPVKPKYIAHQKKSKRVKVCVSPKVFISDKHTTKYYKYTAEERKKYSGFQSGDIEVDHKNNKDFPLHISNHSFYKHKSNVQKQMVELAMNYEKQTKRKKYMKISADSGYNLGLKDWLGKRDFHDTKKTRFQESNKRTKANHKSESRKNKRNKKERRQKHEKHLRENINYQKKKFPKTVI